MPRFYRIVKSDPPSVEDFASIAAKGVPFRGDPDQRRLHDGISVFDSASRARRKARQFPVLGEFIAEVDIPADASARVEKTLGGGHWTVWAPAAQLAGYVTGTASVTKPP